MDFQQIQLDQRLHDAINKAGFETPTPIQEKALPIALGGSDIIGIAQTGTGKTAVFVLATLQKLLKGPRNHVRALIVTPTRELAQQIHNDIKTLSHGTKLHAVAIYGGVNAALQIKTLQRGVEIVIACPGRLLDLINQGHISLHEVEILVLDEADRMLDMGFMPDIKRIIKQMPQKHQTMLFSATFPKEIEKMAAHTLQSPKRIDVGFSNPTKTVAHALYPVPAHLKTEMLLEILKNTKTNSVLVFSRTKRRTYRLEKKIKAAGYKVTSLHGDRSQNQRDAAMQGFRSGIYQVMIATDVAARGLDIDSISHVINYDIPDTADAYVHRIGRTGRAEREGQAFTLVTPEDEKMVRDIEKRVGYKIPTVKLENFDYKAQATKPIHYSNNTNEPKNRQRRSNKSRGW
jgi:ATP-dependent RNA helicase RhlE